MGSTFVLITEEIPNKLCLLILILALYVLFVEVWWKIFNVKSNVPRLLTLDVEHEFGTLFMNFVNLDLV